MAAARSEEGDELVLRGEGGWRGLGIRGGSRDMRVSIVTQIIGMAIAIEECRIQHPWKFDVVKKKGLSCVKAEIPRLESVYECDGGDRRR